MELVSKNKVELKGPYFLNKKKEVLKEKLKENTISLIRRNPNYLEFLDEQTPEICIESVSIAGETLEFVKNQTEEMCYIAVNNNGWALEYAKIQTNEMCLKAVRNTGMALRYVKEKTYEICLHAVRNNVGAILYVPEEYLAEIVKKMNIYILDDFEYTDSEIIIRINSICFDYCVLRNIEYDKDMYKKHIKSKIIEINGEIEESSYYEEIIELLMSNGVIESDEYEDDYDDGDYDDDDYNVW